jgi:hypothetical protein
LKDQILPWVENQNTHGKEFYEKTLELNKKISDLNLIYHQLISQKSILKLESEVISHIIYALDSSKKNFKERRTNKKSE